MIIKNIPDNVVVAGNPCRIICDIDSYYKKIVDNQNREAIRLAQCYKERIKKIQQKIYFMTTFGFLKMKIWNYGQKNICLKCI